MLKKAIFIFIMLGFAFSAFGETILEVENQAPSFQLPNLEGKIFSLDQHLGKKVMVLCFFTSWSKSCQEEIEFLDYLSHEYQNKNLKIIGVSLDRKLSDLETLVSKNKIKLEILHDYKLKTLKTYRILILPTAFLIDLEGKIKYIHVDFDKNIKEALKKEIKNLLTPKEEEDK
jgi:peroxiredoxin